MTGLAYIVMRFMVGSNLKRARQRMRWAWVTGFIMAGIELFLAMILYLAVSLLNFFGFDGAGQPYWTTGQFTITMVEIGLLVGLSYGLKRGSRSKIHPAGGAVAARHQPGDF